MTKRKRKSDSLFGAISNAMQTGQLNDKRLRTTVPLDAPFAASRIEKPKLFPIEVPTDQAHQNSLADEFLRWAHTDENAIAMEQFPIAKCMSPRRFFKVAQYNDYFAQVVEIVQSVIVCRLQKVWFADHTKGNFARTMLSVYWPEYRDILRQKNDALKEGQRIIVQTEPIPSSDIVPPKREE